MVIIMTSEHETSLIRNYILLKVIIYDSQDHARNGYQAKAYP